MQIIKIIAYVCFGLAGLFVISAIAGEELALIAVSISVAVMGVLLLALDKIISTLVEIRDAVVGSEIEATEVMVQSASVDEAEAAKPARSIQEISADLERLKSKL
jgi:predicted RecB family endonuclease